MTGLAFILGYTAATPRRRFMVNAHEIETAEEISPADESTGFPGHVHLVLKNGRAFNVEGTCDQYGASMVRLSQTRVSGVVY